MRKIGPVFNRKRKDLYSEYTIKYEWQRLPGLHLPVCLIVYNAVKSGSCHNQAEVAARCGLTVDYAGKILSQLSAADVIDKVWVTVDEAEIEEDKNVDL